LSCLLIFTPVENWLKNFNKSSPFEQIALMLAIKPFFQDFQVGKIITSLAPFSNFSFTFSLDFSKILISLFGGFLILMLDKGLLFPPYLGVAIPRIHSFLSFLLFQGAQFFPWFN